MVNVNVILDEAASLGPNMGCIEDAIDKYRGYGIRLQLYYQSPAQLKKCFPNDQDQTVMANVTQVFFAVNDNSAKGISERLGDQTIVVQSWGDSCGTSQQVENGSSRGSTSHSGNKSSNSTQTARRLLKEDEVLALDPRIAITFAPGMRPILTRLERYYEKNESNDKQTALNMFCAALVIAVVGACCLLKTFKYVKEEYHVRSLQRFEELRAGSLR